MSTRPRRRHPHKGARRPEVTNERYCVWDVPHEDYLYTDAWVKKLVKELRDRKAFRRIIGHKQRALPEGAGRAAA